MQVLRIALVLAVIVAVAHAGTYTNSQAVSILGGAGISVRSSGGCSNRNNPSCTSLDGIHSECIDGSAGAFLICLEAGTFKTDF